MNGFISALSRASSAHLLEEKWLLAPSRRVGGQWLDQVARGGQAVVNTRLKTLKGLAIELAGPEMVRVGVTPVPDGGAVILVERVFAELRSGFAYLGALEPGARTSETLYRSIRSLRLAGIDAANLRDASFEAAAKGREILEVLKAYVRKLRESHLADPADVLRLAASRLRNDPGAIPAGTLVLIPSSGEWKGLEKTIIEAIPAPRRCVLEVDEPAMGALDRHAATSDLDLLRWIRAPTDAPGPFGDGTVSLFHAVGEVNEVREVLRRARARGIALDEIEILHTDAKTYVPLVYETLLALETDPQLETDPSLETDPPAREKGRSAKEVQPPVTFAEGIPCRYSRPGRALGAWAAWVRGGCPQHALVQMLREGLLEAPGGTEGEPGSSQLAHALRAVGFIAERGQYLPRIDRHIAAMERQAGDSDRDLEVGPAPGEAREKRLRAARVLRSVISALLETVPPPAARPEEILAPAARFLEKLTRSASQLDTFARNRLLETIRERERWTQIAGAADGAAGGAGGGAAGGATLESAGADTWEWLAALPAETSVLGSGPQPGCLHVARAIAGGHSGRPHTFAVGLDDGRFPGSGSQDPLLLDAERRRISPELPTASSRVEREVLELARLLSRLRGTVTFSFSSRDIVEDRDMFPSSSLLTIHRLVSGRRDDDQGGLLRSLPPPASFAPARAEEALDESEWWLWRLCGPEAVANRDEIVARQFPHLERGREAVRKRFETADFTEHDGRVEAAGGDLDPCSPGARAVSASQLETAGECPLRYFFKYALKIEPPEDLEPDPDRWLDPLKFGDLLHRVFEQFLGELIRMDRTPDRDRDSERILAILEERVRELSAMCPPSTASAFRRQRAELERTCRIFLAEEEAYCARTGARPVFLEASIGLKREGHESKLDTAKPVAFPLPDGSSIQVRGRVDRVDRLGGESLHTYVVWDYKTGSSRKYKQGDPFQGGRIIQPALYVSIVEHCLKERVSRNAAVRSFGFFFPGVRARGERLEWAPGDLRAGPTTVQALARIIRLGAFLATDDEKECRYCDYKGVCGDTEAVTSASKKKLENEAEELLQPMRELRSHGEK